MWGNQILIFDQGGSMELTMSECRGFKMMAAYNYNGLNEEYTVALGLLYPDGQAKLETLRTFRQSVYELLDVVLIPLKEDSVGWAVAPDGEKQNAVTIEFPDGDLHIFPDHREIWETED
jgi:hypothetical protein